MIDVKKILVALCVVAAPVMAHAAIDLSGVASRLLM